MQDSLKAQAAKKDKSGVPIKPASDLLQIINFLPALELISKTGDSELQQLKAILEDSLTVLPNDDDFYYSLLDAALKHNNPRGAELIIRNADLWELKNEQVRTFVNWLGRRSRLIENMLSSNNPTVLNYEEETATTWKETISIVESNYPGMLSDLIKKKENPKTASRAITTLFYYYINDSPQSEQYPKIAAWLKDPTNPIEAKKTLVTLIIKKEIDLNYRPSIFHFSIADRIFLADESLVRASDTTIKISWLCSIYCYLSGINTSKLSALPKLSSEENSTGMSSKKLVSTTNLAVAQIISENVTNKKHDDHMFKENPNSEDHEGDHRKIENVNAVDLGEDQIILQSEPAYYKHEIDLTSRIKKAYEANNSALFIKLSKDMRQQTHLYGMIAKAQESKNWALAIKLFENTDITKWGKVEQDRFIGYKNDLLDRLKNLNRWAAFSQKSL